MKNVIFGLFCIGFASLSVSQSNLNNVYLDDVVVTSLNQNYIKAVIDSQESSYITDLEKTVAQYDITTNDAYTNSNTDFEVLFTNANANIKALYDSNGKILKSRELFKNITMPHKVRTALAKATPEWTISKIKYIKNYNANSGTHKTYKVVLIKDGKKQRIKLDAEGNLI